MDIHDLEMHCSSLSLVAEEDDGLDAPVQDVASGSVTHWDIVGRFLTDRAIKFEHMQQVFASVWKPVMGVKIVALDDNMFLFQFPHKRDMQRVIDDGPWSYENQTLVCAPVPRLVRPEEVLLNTIDFWVQIHELPAVYANAEFIAQIGNYVGTFLHADSNNFGGNWRGFSRIRVTLQLSEPLKRRMKLRLRDGNFQWVTFKYERLNTFCFCCGLIGHSEKFCRKAYEEGIEPKDYPYGVWMRAGARKHVKPVGAKWLLADLPETPVCVPSTPAIPTGNLEHAENASTLQGENKRRRNDGKVGSSDVCMNDSPKNLCQAGLVGQTRPSQ